MNPLVTKAMERSGKTLEELIRGAYRPKALSAEKVSLLMIEVKNHDMLNDKIEDHCFYLIRSADI